MNIRKIKSEAKEILHQNFWKILKPYVIVFLITFLISYFFVTEDQNEKLKLTISITTNLLLYPLTIGIMSYILKIIRKEKVNETEIYKFYRSFIFISGLYILVNVFISLWTLLLIIPGIIAALRYSMAPYIMIDGVSDPLECINKSKLLMRGYVWDYFKLYLSFILWIFILPFVFWYVIPYMTISSVLYYEELKKLKN